MGSKTPITTTDQPACPFRKLNPTVLMVKSTQDVASDYAAAALNGSATWGIFLQTEMLTAQRRSRSPKQWNLTGVAVTNSRWKTHRCDSTRSRPGSPG